MHDLFTDDYGWGPSEEPESPNPGCMFAMAVLAAICVFAYLAWKGEL